MNPGILEFTSILAELQNLPRATTPDWKHLGMQIVEKSGLKEDIRSHTADAALGQESWKH